VKYRDIIVTKIIVGDGAVHIALGRKVYADSEPASDGSDDAQTGYVVSITLPASS
jgi:hypothetical protein